jgi:hypothetical protein
MIHATTTRAAVKARPKLGNVLRFARCDHLYIAVFCVTHPAAKFELAGFALHKPAKANTLHAAFNQEMKDHDLEPSSVLQMCSPCASRYSRSCSNRRVRTRV